MVDEWARDDDYEYGYDYLYEEEKPTGAAEDADGPDDDAWWNDELDEAVEKRLADAREADIGDSAERQEAYWQDDEASDHTDADLSFEVVLKDVPIPAKPDEPQTEAEQERHKLKRELKAEALTRLEEAARTAADFKGVTAMWDKLDANRERRERYHEISRGDVPLEYGQNGEGLIFPRWYMNPTARQLARGNFLDYFADCPYEMHDLPNRQYLRKAVYAMKEEHKELLFFLYLRLYSPQRLAVLRGQTGRNVRKVRDVILRKLRKRIHSELERLKDSGYFSITLQESEFLEAFDEKGKARKK